MPPRTKQSGKRQTAVVSETAKKTTANPRSRSRSNVKDEQENAKPASTNAMAPPAKRGTARNNKSRDKSLDQSVDKLEDKSMKSAKSGRSAAVMEEITPAALQAQQELEIQQAFGEVTRQILSGGPDATAVTNVMKRTLVLLMRKSPALFQKTLLAFIERLLTLEVDDSHVRNFYLLLTRVFNEFVQERDRANGVKLIKSVLRQLLEIYNLPKLMPKLQQKTAHMLAMTINATAQKPSTSAGQDQKSGEVDESATQLDKQLADNSTKAAVKRTTRTFAILDDSRADQEIRLQLVETVLAMLSPNGSPSVMQAYGIQIASFMSDYEDDAMFRQMMKLFMQTKSATIREKIIRSFRVPYSQPALAFLGKRLRDVNLNVVELIFKQLTDNGVTISQFPTPEARMLVLTEGFTSQEAKVREACIQFLKPTVLEFAAKNDIAGVLKLIEARLAFGNQYFGRIPGFMTLAILEILENDITLANYLRNVVLKKLRKMAGIPLSKRKSKVNRGQAENDDEVDEFDLGLEEIKVSSSAAGQHDEEMQAVSKESLNDEQEPMTFRPSTLCQPDEEDQDQHAMEVDDVSGDVSFEEILLLRLAFELNRSTKEKRSQYYLDRLEEIVPEYDDYRKITFALANMEEPNLPIVDPKVEKISPYPKGQVGFTRRAILGEWMKFSLQMNIQDEIIRKNLTTLCFELISKIEYSYADYEHLLKDKTQFLRGDDQQSSYFQTVALACQNDDQDLDSDVEELLLEQSNQNKTIVEDAQQETEQQSLEIIIRNFPNIGTARSLQEYCKPFAMETLTLDFDDVCQVAVTVSKTLLGDRSDEFQLKIMEAISDIKESVQDENQGEDVGQRNNAAAMMFSQIPAHQQMEQGPTPSFGKIRAKFMAKIEKKADVLQSMGDEEGEFDIEAFNKMYKQIQIFVQLVEETHLKEKLCYKRALILCRSLLKQCRLANVNDQNVINICETFIYPTVMNIQDKENLLLAFECIGLLCILDREVFLNYSKIFTQILEEETGPDKENRREKVISIKSVVDGLIIHGIGEEQMQSFFDILTTKYIMTKDRILRQVTIEGICKMLFTPKLCDQNDPERVEAILAQLIVQYFDREYSPKNSLVTSILTEFLRNFAPFSEKRCHMLLNALTKVMYAIMREKYGLDHGSQHANFFGKKGAKKQKKAAKKKKASDYDSDESDFQESDRDYCSDDSMFQEQKIQLKQICASLNFVKILNVIPTLLSRGYINKKAMDGFKLKTELSVVFFLRLLKMNKKLFKKTQIVKDVLLPVLDYVSLETCDSLAQLRRVEKQWLKNVNLLVQTTAKISKFQDRLQQRINELEEIEEANEQCPGSTIKALPASETLGGDVDMRQMNGEVHRDSELADAANQDTKDGFDLADLARYWDEHIQDVIVDREKAVDNEIVELQQIWIEQLAVYDTGRSSVSRKNLNDSGKKSILKSPSNFNMRLKPQSQGKSSVSSQPKKQVRTRRGGRQQLAPEPKHGTAMVIGRATGLQAISEESFINSSADPRHRRVRIVEANVETRPRRMATAKSRGTVKSEISEYDSDASEEDDDDEEDSYGSESGEEEKSSYAMTGSEKGADRSNELKTESPRAEKAGQSGPAEAEEESSSQQQHESMMNDNLGRIAKNIARNFAKNSKRMSSGSNDQPLDSATQSANWLQSSGKNTLIIEQPSAMVKQEPQSEDKDMMQGLAGSSSSKVGRKGAPPQKTASQKKQVINDFKAADSSVKKEPIAVKTEEPAEVRSRSTMRTKQQQQAVARQPSSSMRTRREKRSLNSSINSKSLDSKADDDDDDEDSDGAYDFMDGKLTKQLKAKKQAAAAIKKPPQGRMAPPALRLAEKKDRSRDDSKASAASVGSNSSKMLTRQSRRAKK